MEIVLLNFHPKAFAPWPSFGLWQKARSERLARERRVMAGMLKPLLLHDVEQERAFVPWPAETGKRTKRDGRDVEPPFTA